MDETTVQPTTQPEEADTAAIDAENGPPNPSR